MRPRRPQACERSVWLWSRNETQPSELRLGMQEAPRRRQACWAAWLEREAWLQTASGCYHFRPHTDTNPLQQLQTATCAMDHASPCKN